MGRSGLLFVCFVLLALAQPCACGPRCSWPSASSIWPVAVVDYHFGTSQTFGQDSAYFPYNVLGPICTTATPTSPCADPCQIVSLGKGGYVVLAFDPPIADGPGPDFIVFENPFLYGAGQVFEEWMIVEVSQDRQSWLAFPFDSITGTGLAGRTPTGCSSCTGPISWQDPGEAGGDAFDLALVGLPWAKYVKVVDATHFQPPDRLSADLDGVVAIYQLSPQSLSAAGVSPPLHLIGCWTLSGQAVACDALGPLIKLYLDQAGRTYFLRVYN